MRIRKLSRKFSIALGREPRDARSWLGSGLMNGVVIIRAGLVSNSAVVMLSNSSCCASEHCFFHISHIAEGASSTRRALPSVYH